MASSEKSFKKEKKLKKEKRRDEEEESENSRENSIRSEDCEVAPPFDDSGISAESSGSQDSIVLSNIKDNNNDDNNSDLELKTDQKHKNRETEDSQGLEEKPKWWDGSHRQEASHDDDNIEGDSEASSRGQSAERRKLFRKTRKKSLSPNSERSPYNESSSTDVSDAEEERCKNVNKRLARRNSVITLSSALSRNLEVEKHQQLLSPLRRVRASSRSGFFLSRTQSSPSGLGIAEFLASRSLKRQQSPGDQDSLPSCQSSAIRLENRLYGGSSVLAPIRPKLLALGDGSVSVEPRVRKSLTRGTPIRSQSVCFGSIAEVSGDLVGSFSEAAEKLRGKIAQEIIESIEKKDEKKKKKKSKEKTSASISAGRVNELK